MRESSFVFVGVSARLRRKEVKSWLRIPRATAESRDLATAEAASDRSWWLLLSDRNEENSEGLLDGSQSLSDLIAVVDALGQAVLHLGEVWLLRYVGAECPSKLFWNRRVTWHPELLQRLSPLEPGVLVAITQTAE